MQKYKYLLMLSLLLLVRFEDEIFSGTPKSLTLVLDLMELKDIQWRCHVFCPIFFFFQVFIFVFVYSVI